MSEQQEPNWKEIAEQLAQRVNFALGALHSRNSGLLMNVKTGQARHWREYMADGLEMIPGITVDRELSMTFELPRSKQRKAQKELKAKRKSESQDDSDV